MRHNGTTIVSKLLAAAAALAFAMAPAHAEDKAKQPTSIWEQDTLTGDWGGARTALKDKGIDITLISINEIMSVLSGGRR
jgi:porin